MEKRRRGEEKRRGGEEKMRRGKRRDEEERRRGEGEGGEDGKITPNYADLGFDQFKTLILKSRETR